MTVAIDTDDRETTRYDVEEAITVMTGAVIERWPGWWVEEEDVEVMGT